MSGIVQMESTDGSRAKLPLTQWLSHFSPFLDANSLVAQFGLKNTSDVHQFLKSEAGKTINALIANALDKENRLQVDRLQATIQQIRHDEESLAYALLGLVYANESQENKLDEESQRLLSRLKTKPSIDKKPLPNTRVKPEFDALTKSAEALESLLMTKHEETLALTDTLSELEQEKTMLHAHHRDTQATFHSLFNAINLVDLLTITPEKHQEIRALLQEKQIECNQRIDEETTRAATEIVLNDKRLFANSFQSTHKHYMLGALCKELLSILDNHHAQVYYDEEGMPTHDASKIHYILKQNMTLIKHNNALCLIPLSLAASPREADLFEGQQLFQKNQSSLFSVNARYKQHVHAEQTHISNRHIATQTELDRVKQEIQVMQSALSTIQGALGRSEGLANQLRPTPPRPEPRKIIKEKEDSYTLMIKKLIQKGPSSKQAKTLVYQLEQYHPTHKREKKVKQNALSALTQGGPLTPELVQSMNQMGLLNLSPIAVSAISKKPAPRPR